MLGNRIDLKILEVSKKPNFDLSSFKTTKEEKQRFRDSKMCSI